MEKDRTDQWLEDIRRRKLRVVTIICYSDIEGNYFYGWPEDKKGPEEFIQQLRRFADDIENRKHGKVTFSNIY